MFEGIFEQVEVLREEEQTEGDLLAAGRENWPTVPFESIDRDPNQPRRNFDRKKLEELKASLIARGKVINPLRVRRIEGVKDEYVLINGERRWRAIKEILASPGVPLEIRNRFSRVPVVVEETVTRELVNNPDREDKEIVRARVADQIAEGQLQEKYTALEEADKFYQILMPNESAESLAKYVGRDHKYVERHLRVARVLEPEERAVFYNVEEMDPRSGKTVLREARWPDIGITHLLKVCEWLERNADKITPEVRHEALVYLATTKDKPTASGIEKALKQFLPKSAPSNRGRPKKIRVAGSLEGGIIDAVFYIPDKGVRQEQLIEARDMARKIIAEVDKRLAETSKRAV